MPSTQTKDQSTSLQVIREDMSRMVPEIQKALPPEVKPERFLRVALTTISSNPDLVRCDRMSLLQSITTIAQLGLLPDPVLGEAYIVPYGRTATPIIGYKGLCKLARQSGEIDYIEANPVRENDFFEYELGANATLTHKPPKLGEDRGEIIGFYAVAYFKNGARPFNVMSKAEVDAVKKKAKAQSGPWSTHYEEMGRKTPIRKLAKDLPLSVQKALAIDEQYDLGNASVIVDGELEVVQVPQEGEDEPQAQETPQDALRAAAEQGQVSKKLSQDAVDRVLGEAEKAGLTAKRLEEILMENWGETKLADVEATEAEIVLAIGEEGS